MSEDPEPPRTDEPDAPPPEEEPAADKQVENETDDNVENGGEKETFEEDAAPEEEPVEEAQVENGTENGVEKDNTMFDDEDLKAVHGHGEQEDVTIYWNIRRTASKPVNCCCCLCGVWVFLIIVLVGLGAAVGSIEFTVGVPFYDRSEINQEREDSYEATSRDADYVSTIGEGSFGECVHEDPTVLTRNGTLVQGPAPTAGCQRASSQFLRLVYISSDRTSNVLKTENLEQIKKIEDEILSHIHLTRYCYLLNSSYYAFETRDTEEWQRVLIETEGQDAVTAACERIESPVNHLDSLYFDTSGDETGLGYYLLPADQVPQEYNYSQSWLDFVVDYWSNFGQQRNYDLTEFPAAVQTVGSEVNVQNLFWRVTSSEFSTGSTSAVGMTSTYSLGLPLNTYESSSLDAEDQYADVGQWLWDEFDSFLKDASFEGVDVYFNDNKQEMEGAEEGFLAIQSMSLFPISIVLVLLYLMIMQDSFYLGLAGIMQVLLSFVPTLILYRYVFGIEYLGVLNLISFYIILGIGVDDIFVFSDQFKLQGTAEKRFDQRLQKTFNTASKAMFTTSCTTFISFISNYTSVFPAVSTFGLFSALLVLVNFLAVTTFFPAVYSVYHSRIRKTWWDHPSRLFCCNKSPVPEDGDGHVKTQGEDEAEAEEKEGAGEADENGLEAESAEKEAEAEENGAEAEPAEKQENGEEQHGGEDSFLVRFFRDVWAPIVIKGRYFVLLLFVGILVIAVVFASQLTADENPPSTLPDDNPYKIYSDVIIDFFSRAGNPRAIDVRWMSGIDPDSPIDRTGTDDTISDDYGTANYRDCTFYNPTTADAQVWSLQTCQDLFYGNWTELHGGDESFLPDGDNGPKARKMVSDKVPMDDYHYYSKVICPAQSLRDWLLTDNGCDSLLENGLQCFNETSQRPNCTTWGDDATSCEPYPVPSDRWAAMMAAFMQDEDVNPTTRYTNYDTFKTQVFVDDEFTVDTDKAIQDDFSCRTVEEGTLVGISAVATTDQDFALNYEDGISLYDKWDAWSGQMRSTGPREMAATMQTSNGAWSFYFLNETLLSETFMGIMLSLVLCFVVLSLVGGNFIMAFYSVFTILLIVVDIIAFTVIVGWDLGVIEAVNYVVVIGMSIDYSVHMSEAYTEAHGETRSDKVTAMIEEMAVSVLSGALSTLLATFPMFFAPNVFFVKFASFMFCTIAMSCIYALVFFPALLATIGPLGNLGMIWVYLTNLRKHLVHDFTKRHVKSKQFRERESMMKKP